MGILSNIQAELKAPKNQFNSFGKYNYRSCEDILEAVKPLLTKHGATLALSDEIVAIGGRVYVKATAKFSSTDGEIEISAFAREAETKKGSDEAQITGAASSYARKYALNGLFLIDDSKDADTNEYGNNGTSAAKPLPKAPTMTPEHIAEMKKWKDGTFTEEELAKIKDELRGVNWVDNYSKAKAEYERRKAAKPVQQEEIF